MLPGSTFNPTHLTQASPTGSSAAPSGSGRTEGASTDIGVIYGRLAQLALPYWTDPVSGGPARWKLAGVVGLTLATTGVSVVFNFLGRDFFNALSEKDEALFNIQLVKYLAGFLVGVPVFVLKGYFQSRLALEWRTWLTQRLMDDYFSGRTFYALQSQAVVDNPDQRISSDAANFTGTALNLALVLLSAGIDLVSFSGILYSIYPPLFVALLAYSATGTTVSLVLGKPLVGLNFAQEAREADLRYGLVRVRENAEAVAFYRGESDESALLGSRLKAAVENYMGLLVASRNLDFFTSLYRYLIQLLPAAVVAPLFFKGQIEFGVINQSQSAFNHVLNDLSLVVYQLESLAGFSAVIDRLGQFQEAMAASKPPSALPATSTATSSAANGLPDARAASPLPGIRLEYPGALQGPGQPAAGSSGGGSSGAPGRQGGAQGVLLSLAGLCVQAPGAQGLLVRDLDLQVLQGQPLLIMGPSGAGKTSILRALAGLWSSGAGQVAVHVPENEVMFLPQKPYMVLGSLRDQVLYPRFPVNAEHATAALLRASSDASLVELQANPQASPAQPAPAGGAGQGAALAAPPSDDAIVAVLRQVRLGHLLARYAQPAVEADAGSPAGSGVPSSSSQTSASSALGAVVDWSSSLSLGEQQRLAWARLLLTQPRLALLDEASSALDAATESELYQVLAQSGITYISVGHRPSLRQYHAVLLQLSAAASDAPAAHSSQVTVNGSRMMGPGWELQPCGVAIADVVAV